ncbi:hypothetical protein XENTR_v10003126 [Xenopus tropicalis]|nr:hypothetical protein XENTR_v10003126 [Xenopus tropicalis]
MSSSSATGTESVIDAFALGREANNGCARGAALCHPTRGLKDGRLGYYQSSLDQDVILPAFPFLSLSFFFLKAPKVTVLQ